jgi:type VI secretion system secreted protein Hcp
MKTPLLLTLIVFLALPRLSQAAAVDYFLKIDGIEGESTEEGHAGEIHIESFSWGLSQEVATGGGTGKVLFQDFHFEKKIDKATPKLMEACAKGTHLPAVQLVGRRANERGETSDYLVITLKDASVVSYQTGGSAGDIVPTNQLSLNFAEIKFEYFPQNPDGSLGTPVEFTYNIREQTAARE